MSWFEATSTTEALVEASAPEIWALLSDPAVVARLTPLVTEVTRDGDRWTWRMGRVPVVGVVVDPVFTEQMTFTEPRRIDFTHAPAPGAPERAGVEGWYTLDPTSHGTELAIELTVRIDLPLPRVTGPAVRTAMRGVIASIGTGFSRNLLRELRATA